MQVILQNKMMSISGGFNATSHKGTRNNDFAYTMGPISFNIDLEVIAVYGTNDTNSVVFRSVDSGLELPYGKLKEDQYLYIRCAHMNKDKYDELGIKVGKVFKAYEPIYYPGTAGVNAPHIHTEFGIGKKDYYKGLEKTKYGTYWFANPIYSLHPYEAFYLIDGCEVVVRGDYRDAYAWQYASDTDLTTEIKKILDKFNSDMEDLLNEYK